MYKVYYHEELNLLLTEENIECFRLQMKERKCADVLTFKEASRVNPWYYSDKNPIVKTYQFRLDEITGTQKGWRYIELLTLSRGELHYAISEIKSQCNTESSIMFEVLHNLTLQAEFLDKYFIPLRPLYNLK